MEKNEVNEALKALLKKSGVKTPNDLIGNKIKITGNCAKNKERDSFDFVFFAKIESIQISYENFQLQPIEIIIKLSGAPGTLFYLLLQSKWVYSSPKQGLSDVELFFSKKWWQIF